MSISACLCIRISNASCPILLRLHSFQKFFPYLWNSNWSWIKIKNKNIVLLYPEHFTVVNIYLFFISSTGGKKGSYCWLFCKCMSFRSEYFPHHNLNAPVEFYILEENEFIFTFLVKKLTFILMLPFNSFMANALIYFCGLSCKGIQSQWNV